MGSVFDEIRAGAEAVCARARWVRIHADRIAAYAASLPERILMFGEPDPECHFLGHGADTAAYLLILDSINFGSGYSPCLKKRRGKGFYFTVASCLGDFVRARGVPGPAELQRFTVENLARIFEQDPASPPLRELLELFRQALAALGALVERDYGGSFADLIGSAEGSAEKLVGVLRRMPFFEDVHAYHGLRVPFYKRAQITAADLYRTFEGRDFGAFEDIDRLTAFADNTVPHVLHLDGILSYRPELLDRIAKLEPLVSGSPEEIEIRAAAVQAVELIVEALARAGTAVSAPQIDELLWLRGQEALYKSQPSHKARCVYY